MKTKRCGAGKNRSEEASNGTLEFVEDEELESPICAHGPTFLFRRVTASGKSTLFYACAAYRDRKKCSFYLSKEDHERKKRRKLEGVDVIQAQRASAKESSEAAIERLQTVRRLPSAQRTFCLQCDRFVLRNEASEHRDHKLKSGVGDDLLTQPTGLLELTVQNKAEAQFIFSNQSADFILNALKRERAHSTVLIGCPRLFELLRQGEDGAKKKAKKDAQLSLLLDIDERYAQFYEPSVFQRYNMFNHFFFDSQFDPADWLKTAFQTTGRAPTIVIDPPFGGLTDALCATLSKWRTLWTEVVNQVTNESQALPLNIVWIFPYFHERRIRRSLRDLNMLDYRVTYVNHPRFTVTRLRNKPSPIRVFTNLPKSAFRFQDEANASNSDQERSFYRWCDQCNAVAFLSNNHCEACSKCSTKHGPTYRHCDQCARCVKPKRVHCDSCGRCVLSKQHKHQLSSPGDVVAKERKRKNSK